MVLPLYSLVLYFLQKACQIPDCVVHSIESMHKSADCITVTDGIPGGDAQIALYNLQITKISYCLEHMHVWLYSYSSYKFLQSRGTTLALAPSHSTHSPHPLILTSMDWFFHWQCRPEALQKQPFALSLIVHFVLTPGESQASTLLNAGPWLDARPHWKGMPPIWPPSIPSVILFVCCCQVWNMNDVAILHHCNCVTVMFIALFSSNNQFFPMKGIHMELYMWCPLITLDFSCLLAYLPLPLGAICSLLLINLRTCIMSSRVVLNLWW